MTKWIQFIAQMRLILNREQMKILEKSGLRRQLERAKDDLSRIVNFEIVTQALKDSLPKRETLELFEVRINYLTTTFKNNFDLAPHMKAITEWLGGQSEMQKLGNEILSSQEEVAQFLLALRSEQLRQALAGDKDAIAKLNSYPVLIKELEGKDVRPLIFSGEITIEKFLTDMIPYTQVLLEQVKAIFIESNKFEGTNSSGVKSIQKLLKQPNVTPLEVFKKIKDLAVEKTTPGGFSYWYSHSTLFGKGRHKNIDLLYKALADLPVDDNKQALCNKIEEIIASINNIEEKGFIFSNN